MVLPLRGRADYDDKAILAAAGDQDLGYDMLMQYLTGSVDEGTGPFAGFLESYYRPLATAAINALSFINPSGDVPRNINDLFANIESGGPDGNIYDYLGGLAEQAIGSQLRPGANVSFTELSKILDVLNPLTTLGMNRVSANQFRRQQGDTLRNMQVPSYWDMNNQNNRKDWGDFFTASPFFQQWYGGDVPFQSAASVSPTVAQANRANASQALNVDPAAERRKQQGGGGGAGGLLTP